VSPLRAVPAAGGRLFVAAWSVVATSLFLSGSSVLADTITRQVKIDVKIVEVSRNSARKLRIDTRIADALGKLPPDASKLSSPQAAVSGLGVSPSVSDVGQRFFPNNQAPGDMKFTGLLTNPQFRAILDVLNRANAARVLSQPTILVPDNQRASIPISPSVPFPKGPLTLNATPHLGPNGNIEMAIVPTVEPRKVPNTITVGLGDVPVLGGLFQKTPKYKEHLIILVTAQPVDVFSHSSSGKGSDPVKIDAIGTGETIGHIGDLKIQNLTDGPLNFFIPPLILESINGANQDYVCPKGRAVAIDPHGAATVPMDGVCINRKKPPVGKGVSGALVVNTVDPAIAQHPDCHIPTKEAGSVVRICDSIYDAVDKLQKDGEFDDFPYKDKKEQQEILVQWSTWANPRISEVTKEPPATKDDLKKVVYKQVEEKGKPSRSTKKKLDKGIDTIFEKVELTNEKAKDLEQPDPFAGVELTGEKAKDEKAPPAQSQSPSPSG
jgi:hypothetical protein